MKRTDLLWPLLCLAALSCTTAPSADRSFESGDLGAALTQYEATPSARSLYFMAMIHLDQEWFDPQRAIELLEQLAIEYPQSPYTRIGTLWLGNWRERDRLAAELAGKLRIIATLQSESEVLVAQLDETQSGIDEGESKLRELTVEIEHLKAEVASLSNRLEERERDLEELMRIDLESEPLDTSRTPSY